MVVVLHASFLNPTPRMYFMRQTKDTERFSPSFLTIWSLCAELRVACVCARVCLCVSECEATWGISPSTPICASSCLSFPLWLPLPHTVCVLRAHSQCAHRAGLRRKINHSRWLLWNLITLIICTSRPNSPLLSPGKPLLFTAQPLRSHMFICI